MTKTQILLLCVTVWVAYTTAKPYETNSFVGQTELDRCNRIAEVDITCQKCAKITKSSMAYPMCCTDKEDAYRWCVKYLNFGLQKRSHHKENPPWERKHHAIKNVLVGEELHELYLPDINTNMV